MSSWRNNAKDKKTSNKPSTSAREIERLITRKVERLTRGSVFKPSPSPPEFDYQPWNSATIRYLEKVSKRVSITTDQLYELLSHQVGAYVQNGTVYTKCNIEWKLQSVAAWDIENDNQHGFIRLLPINFITKRNSNTQELANPSSMGQKNMYPCVGYRYPVDHQNFVIYSPNVSSSETKYNVCIIDVTDNTTVEAHFKVLWRCAQTSEIKLRYVVTPSNPLEDVCDVRTDGLWRTGLTPKLIEHIVQSFSEGSGNVLSIMKLLADADVKDDCVVPILNICQEELQDVDTASTSSSIILVEPLRRSGRLKEKLMSLIGDA